MTEVLPKLPFETGKSQTVTGRSVMHETVQGPGYDALVAAHNRALGSVSRDIASAIREASGTRANMPGATH